MVLEGCAVEFDGERNVYGVTATVRRLRTMADGCGRGVEMSHSAVGSIKDGGDDGGSVGGCGRTCDTWF
jgi:hypothetical protein